MAPDRMNGVVPVAVEAVRGQAHRGHLGIGDRLPLRIGTTVELTPHAQPGGSAGGGDQVDDHRQTRERPPAPIAADIGEQSMLDLVPLARSGWEVADGDRHPDLVGHLLQLPLPQAHSRPLLPPQSAVMSSARARGYRGRPICCHHRRIVRAAKLAVS